MTSGKDLKRRYRGPLDRDLRTSAAGYPFPGEIPFLSLAGVAPADDDVVVDFSEAETNRQEADLCWEQHKAVQAMVREWQIELCWQASRPWRA